MAPEVETLAALAGLRAEIGWDRQALRLREGEVLSLRDATPWQPGAPFLAAVAVALHHYYTALETILDRIVRVFEGLSPAGPDSHRHLLDVAALEIPEVRPAILKRETRDFVEPLLKFRHFFRLAYAVTLDPGKLAARADELAVAAPKVNDDLDRFDAYLAQAIAELRARSPSGAA